MTDPEKMRVIEEMQTPTNVSASGLYCGMWATRGAFSIMVRKWPTPLSPC